MGCYVLPIRIHAPRRKQACRYYRPAGTDSLDASQTHSNRWIWKASQLAEQKTKTKKQGKLAWRDERRKKALSYIHIPKGPKSTVSYLPSKRYVSPGIVSAEWIFSCSCVCHSPLNRRRWLIVCQVAVFSTDQLQPRRSTSPPPSRVKTREEGRNWEKEKNKIKQGNVHGLGSEASLWDNW